MIIAFFFYFDLANFCAVLNGLAPWFSSIDQWLCGFFLAIIVVYWLSLKNLIYRLFNLLVFKLRVNTS